MQNNRKLFLDTNRRIDEESNLYVNDSSNRPNLNKIFLGIVKDNRDFTYMGRLRVYIPDLGGRPDDRLRWYTVQYCSPFAGATSPINVVKDKNDFESVQQSYGFWMVPPDLENVVVVAFINGEPNRGIWLGCLYQQNTNFMVPGIPAYNVDVQGKKVPLPSLEYNKRNNNVDPFSPNRREFTPLAESLINQGLIGDFERGLTTAGARRETPSQVFGFKTPRGHHIYIDDGEIEVDQETKKPIIRGQEIKRKEKSVEYIRLRTRTGTQILINDTNGYIYMNIKSGKTWLRLSDNGLEIYTSEKFNIRAEKEMNIHCDGDINIFSGGSFNLSSENGIFINTEENLNLKAKQNIFIDSEKNTEMFSENLIVSSEGKISIKSKNAIGLASQKIVQNTSDLKNAERAGFRRKKRINSVETIVTNLTTKEPYEGHIISEYRPSLKERELGLFRERRGQVRSDNYSSPDQRLDSKTRSELGELDKCTSTLSAKYESNGDPGAIGYDAKGGYSYGSIQIASRVGSLGSFLKYLEEKDPEIAKRLNRAGGEQAGRRGDLKFKTAWKDIAKENPDRFRKLQEDWNYEQNFGPTDRYLKSKYGIDLNESPTLKAVLYSTATQHGPYGANRLFDRAFQNVSGDSVKNLSKERIINRIYNERGRTNSDGRLTYFSDPKVQEGVKRRLENERRDALRMLRAEKNNSLKCK